MALLCPRTQSNFTGRFYKLKKKLKKKLKNSSKKLKKSAFFETLFVGNAFKKEACNISYPIFYLKRHFLCSAQAL